MKSLKNLSFSKLILMLVMASFFVVLAVGLYVILKRDSSQLYALFTFVGAPVAVAIGFYYKKAEAENKKGGITYDTAMKNFECEPEEQGDAEG